MRHFEVHIENKPGSLANICETLARNAINILAISTDGSGVIRVVTEDENSTRDILKKNNFRFDEAEILPVRLIDRPGELGKVARQLAKANVNVDAVYILDKDKENKTTEVALKVNDLKKAREVLKSKM